MRRNQRTMLSRSSLRTLTRIKAWARYPVTHLLPRAEREPRRFSLIALGAGILTAAVVVASKG